MDLLSLVLSLRPLPAAEPAAVAPAPTWWGRAAHALLLKVVRQVDDILAAELHADAQATEELPVPEKVANSVRPFTCSSLMGHFKNNATQPQFVYQLRLTAFRPDLAGILAQASVSGLLTVGQVLELDYQSFEVLSVQPALGSESVSPWAASNTYQQLSAPYLLGKTPAPTRISLQLTSPTTFKSAGKHMPLPLPGLVFGSLLERWNAYAPISFPPEVKRYAEECLVISQYDLHSRPVPQKGRGLRMGAVGNITYSTLNYDRYWMGVLAVLAHFSLYSGLGAGTAQGLGQCRILQGETAPGRV